MATADANRGGPLAGHVEIDETILGGRRPPKRKWENKTVVMGMVERGGKIIAGAVPDQTTYTLEGIVNENVVEGSTISTDDLASYGGLLVDVRFSLIADEIIAPQRTTRRRRVVIEGRAAGLVVE